MSFAAPIRPPPYRDTSGNAKHPERAEVVSLPAQAVRANNHEATTIFDPAPQAQNTTTTTTTTTIPAPLSSPPPKQSRQPKGDDGQQVQQREHVRPRFFHRDTQNIHHVHFTTHPLFPPLPVYDKPTTLDHVSMSCRRTVSFFLSLTYLQIISAGAAFNAARMSTKRLGQRMRGINPTKQRKFYKEEQERKKARKEAARRWDKKMSRRRNQGLADGEVDGEVEVDEEYAGEEFPPLEGGKDKLICDVGYYARRVGLDVEEFKVQTEDGFVIQLWHVYNPREYTRLSEEERGHRDPRTFTGYNPNRTFASSNRKYPVLLMHGLLQCSGAYCTNDDDSLAFFLCKSGYDVWLGNNRCGMHPEHTTLSPSDPRMWAWNIRHMGVLDLAALISRVLYETGFEKLALACHSQGTTQTFVALAKEQRPELGQKISVFCGLAPAAYAGPLIERKRLRWIRSMSSRAFRVVFGIHAFIPFMMTMHSLLPARVYGDLGYVIFAFLFNWSDDRWDRELRARMFQFAPVYVSAETMRWWLGGDCFAAHKCILTTHEDGLKEDEEDFHFENVADMETYHNNVNNNFSNTKNKNKSDDSEDNATSARRPLTPSVTKSDTAWFGADVPPFALWIAGNDHLVDGHKLLRRFRNGREPHVRLVHAKVIEEYEHLDVLWAMDMIEQVGKEVREVIWKTMPEDARRVCRVPRGVEGVEPYY